MAGAGTAARPAAGRAPTAVNPIRLTPVGERTRTRTRPQPSATPWIATPGPLTRLRTRRQPSWAWTPGTASHCPHAACSSGGRRSNRPSCTGPTASARIAHARRPSPSAASTATSSAGPPGPPRSCRPPPPSARRRPAATRGQIVGVHTIHGLPCTGWATPRPSSRTGRSPSSAAPPGRRPRGRSSAAGARERRGTRRLRTGPRRRRRPPLVRVRPGPPGPSARPGRPAAAPRPAEAGAQGRGHRAGAAQWHPHAPTQAPEGVIRQFQADVAHLHSPEGCILPGHHRQLEPRWRAPEGHAHGARAKASATNCNVAWARSGTIIKLDALIHLLADVAPAAGTPVRALEHVGRGRHPGLQPLPIEHRQQPALGDDRLDLQRPLPQDHGLPDCGERGRGAQAPIHAPQGDPQSPRQEAREGCRLPSAGDLRSSPRAVPQPSPAQGAHGLRGPGAAQPALGRTDLSRGLRPAGVRIAAGTHHGWRVQTALDCQSVHGSER